MTAANLEQVSPHNEQVPKFGKRHVQVILLATMLTIAIGMRMELSIAIVAMNDNTTSPNPDIPTFQWTNKSIVLSSFYWGYITLQLLGGSVGRKYGTKMLLIVSMGVNAIVCLLLPTTAVKFGSYGVIVCRIIQGITQGFLLPSVYNILGCWAPVNERSRLGSFGTAGFAFGSIIGQPLTGYISSSWVGWPAAFYLYGCLSVIWTIFWIIFGASTPADHKSITRAEKEYIESSLGIEEDEKPTNVPWKSIFTSAPVWSLTFCHIGMTYGTIALANETPIYMNKVLGFDLQVNSVLSSASSVAALIISLVCGQIADFLINRRYLTRGVTRKLFGTIVCSFSALAMLVLSFLSRNDKVWSVLMFTLVGFATGATSGGPSVNQIDLSPRYAGIIMAITNSCSTVFSIIGPVVVQIIVKDETDTSQWRLFFLSAMGMYVLANVVYVVFGSADLQPWDSNGLDTSKQKDVDERRRKVSMLSWTGSTM